MSPARFFLSRATALFLLATAFVLLIFWQLIATKASKIRTLCNKNAEHPHLGANFSFDITALAIIVEGYSIFAMLAMACSDLVKADSIVRPAQQTVAGPEAEAGCLGVSLFLAGIFAGALFVIISLKAIYAAFAYTSEAFKCFVEVWYLLIFPALIWLVCLLGVVFLLIVFLSWVFLVCINVVVHNSESKIEMAPVARRISRLASTAREDDELASLT